jgi:hypothetical protein
VGAAVPAVNPGFDPARAREEERIGSAVCAERWRWGRPQEPDFLKRGLTVPDTVSSIARDHDNIFESVLPPIARHAMAPEAYVHQLSRLVLKMVSNCDHALERNPVFPT